jgi:hypothetical protein
MRKLIFETESDILIDMVIFEMDLIFEENMIF